MKFSASLLAPAVVVITLPLIGNFKAARTNPILDPGRTIEAHMAIPENVHSILRRSCYDCHSNETHWPWYAGLPGISGVVQADVRRARKRLNLSDWSAKLGEGQDEAHASLNGICEELRSDSMPISKYRWMHPNAALSASEVDSVCAWTADAQKH